MDDYQKHLVSQFFEPLPTLSQESCHQFILHHIAPILLPNAISKIDIQPSPFQGSMSYTTILHTHEHCFAFQFRTDKQDLYGVSEAHRIHGPIVPMVTYQGMYEGLFVYISPFAEGIPYASILMSSEDSDLPLEKKMVTTMDLSSLVTQGARANTTVSNTAIPKLTSTLDEIHQKLRDLAALPIILTHQDLSPFNYLIDESTGHIQAVLDWDSAIYLPVGSNFHFMDTLFGYMTPTGWQDGEDHQELEAAFYNGVLTSLAVQGFQVITKEQLEGQKAVGMLMYGVERLLKFEDEQAEYYLDGYLRGLSFMDESLSSY